MSSSMALTSAMDGPMSSSLGAMEAMSTETRSSWYVICPMCFSLLMEPPSVPVYRCGSCGTILRAKYRGAPVIHPGNSPPKKRVTHPDLKSGEQNSSPYSLEGSTQTSKSISSDDAYTQASENVVDGVSNSDRAREREREKQAEMSSSMAITSAMDAPMSSSLGAMGPLLRKLDSLLPPDYRLPKLLKDRIELLRADLEEISVALVEQSMVDSPNEMAKYWMNEVRELIYDIEDFIDNMMSRHADAKMGSVQGYKVSRVKIAWLPKTRKPCTRAAKIAELRTLVREASERYDRYLDFCTTSSRRVFTGHGRVPALYAEAANNLVGVDDSKMKLIKCLTDNEEQQLKVVAIVGPAGVGKTTLANHVYHELGAQFECRAFVRASRKPDMRRLLGGILSQIQGYRRPFDSCTVQNLIDNLTQHLQDKRYFIVIDDLWETTAWDIVISAFPEGNNCSRIITTTEIEGVALVCCDYQSNNILMMKPLGEEDSGKLFVNLVFGIAHICPKQLSGASNIIINKCGGLPLATTFVAGLLTTQPNNIELWQHVHECLCSTLSTNSTIEETLQEILKLTYNSLPHYLKTCLMYLSVYPEGYTLWKIDLAKQWIAEGFIRATEGTDTWEVADSYFQELVNRGMIQPVDINYNGEVLSCTLHHIVLDRIALDSTEERFITALDYSETISEHYSKARRLSLHFSNTRYTMKPTGLTLSKVRSILFFGILECVPTVVEFKYLRVLTLEFWGDQRGSTSFNLTRICRLFQLRYLKIVCGASVEVELPTQMRMLRYLETLIIDAAVSAVPLDIVNLPGLLHLSLGDKTDLPDEIGRIRSLRTLHCFDLGSNSEDNVLSLGDLKNLQDLHLTYCTEESNEHLKRNLAAVASSLGKLVNLKSVTLAPGASGTAIYHDVWSSMSSFPIFLQRLELLPPICIFSRLPKWIGQLRKLHTLKVVVSELLMEDMDTLIGLPALTILSLYVRRPTTESVILRRGAFLGLKYFKYTCGVLSLVFQEEAFPNLQRLELSFNAHRGIHYDRLLSGIDYLLNLKEIVGTIGAAAGAEESDRRAAESAFKDAIRKHPRFPSYDNIKRVDQVCEEYQLRTQGKDSSSEKHEILQKEQRRKEGDSSDDRFRILLKKTEEDTKQYLDRHVDYPSHSLHSQWKKGKLLGSGTFGQVYLGFNSEGGQMCAIKEVKVIADDSNSKECLRQLNQEMLLLNQLSHPNIVQYYGSELSSETLSVYNEYVSGGSIHKLLQEYGPFKEPVLRNYTIQILSGLAYLHGRKTVHRNIKGANILVDPNGDIKLADFGMAKHTSSFASIISFKGSPYWMAPEVIMNSKGYSLPVDIWSLGCTILEMATARPPWTQYEGVAAIFKIANSKDIPDIPDHLSSEAKSFLRLCLQRDPAARPTAVQLIEHPWVKDQASVRSSKSGINLGTVWSQTGQTVSPTRTAPDHRCKPTKPQLKTNSTFGNIREGEEDVTAKPTKP